MVAYRLLLSMLYLHYLTFFNPLLFLSSPPFHPCPSEGENWSFSCHLYEKTVNAQVMATEQLPVSPTHSILPLPPRGPGKSGQEMRKKGGDNILGHSLHQQCQSLHRGAKTLRYTRAQQHCGLLDGMAFLSPCPGMGGYQCTRHFLSSSPSMIKMGETAWSIASLSFALGWERCPWEEKLPSVIQKKLRQLPTCQAP